MDPLNTLANFDGRSFTRTWDNSGYLQTLGSLWICRSRSPKVVDFGTNQKRLCDFLLARHSNLGPILHPFGDIAGFFVLLNDHTPIPPVAPDPDRPCWCQPAHWP